MNNFHNRIITFAVITLFLLFSSSCRKLIETEPPSDKLTDESAFLTEPTAIGVLNGLYWSTSISFQGKQGLSVYPGLSSDELIYFDNLDFKEHTAYYKNMLASNKGIQQNGHQLWPVLYSLVFRCNSALTGLLKSQALRPVVKQQLLGEAKFLRSLYYFYLVNLFGELPLVLSTDPDINIQLSRSSEEDIYNQIKTDLMESENLLSEDFLDGTLLLKTSERVRPTKWSAKALLARVYLYTQQYDKAEEKASEIIANSTLFGPLPPLSDAFLKNNKEAIWQIQPTTNDYNTIDGRMWLITTAGPNDFDNPFYLSQNLLNSFETNDQRKAAGNWINRSIYAISSTPLVEDTLYCPYKYKISTSPGVDFSGLSEYFMVLRLAEQYLIRAEARAYQGDNEGSQSDLNIIRARAGLANTTASNKDALLYAILKERQVELFCELGHRWLDLKRTGNVDEVMSIVTPQKAEGAAWQSYQQLYPLPLSEIERAPNIKQNPSY